MSRRVGVRTSADEAFSRLPKWAQRHMEGLERQVANLEEHIAELSAGPEDSNVRVSGWSQPDRLLGSGVHVDFYLGQSRQRFRDMVTVHHARPGVLRLQGSETLCVWPSASNVVEVSVQGLRL